MLSGRGTELERDAPFAAIVEALDDFLGSLPPAQLEGLGDRLPHLAGVFPTIASRVEARSGPAEERYRHHRAIGGMLEELAAARPLVLVLDDVHWADAASVEAIAHLLRRPPSARLLLVLCYRTGQASPVLIGALEAASREGRTDDLVLGTLTDSETAALLVGESDAAQQRIFAESGGNPFYIEQLQRAGDGDPEVAAIGPVAGQATVQIPPAVLAAIRQELRYLPDPALRMLEGAAVAGEPFEPALAAEAADVDPERALELLDELVARDLVRAEPSARLFGFRHPIVRRAVYDSIPPGRRLAAHGRTANALGRLGARPAARAHHVALSARRGDDAAVDALTDAALEVADTAPASAAHWLSVALTLMPAERTKRHVAMLANLAQVQTAAGAMDDARETLVTITREPPVGSGPVWSQAVATLATVELELGRHSGARRRLEAAVEAIEDPTSVQVVPLLLALAIDVAYQRGDFLRGAGVPPSARCRSPRGGGGDDCCRAVDDGGAAGVCG